MRKIFILTGLVLFFVLVIMVCFFFGNLSEYANFLGDKSSGVATGEKSKFYGVWETNYIEGDDRFIGSNGFYRFKTDGTGIIGGSVCLWELEEDKLVISHNGGYDSLTYDFSFENDDNTLFLSNSNGTLEFSIQLS